MTTAQLQLYGSTLKSVGISLVGGGVVIMPTSAPSWLIVAMAVTGVVFQVVGVTFSHLAASQQNVQIASVNKQLNPPNP